MEKEKEGWVNEPMNLTRGHVIAIMIGFLGIGYMLAYLLKRR